MSTGMLRVGITRKKQDVVTQPPGIPVMSNFRSGFRFSFGSRVLFPMRKVFITLMPGYSRRCVMIFPEMCQDIYVDASGYLCRCVMLFPGMRCRLYGNALCYFPEWCDAFGEMPDHLCRNNPPHFPKWCNAFDGMTHRIPRNGVPHMVK